jgi:UDP-N-acetylmuramoyl-L-alanyl-D-glutamate--2,6-diaminopimelate ligase
VAVAVTGTNGKTSVASFTRQIWATLGHAACNLGTVGVEGAFSAPLAHTTPEPVELHALLAEMARAGVTHLAMEASSHGLDQRRLDGVRLIAGGFTNLTRDHLDYHGSMDAYLAAKLGLFTRVLPDEATAVVNFDDAYGTRVAEAARDAGLAVIGTGRRPEAAIRLLGQRFDATGQELRFSLAGEVHQLRLGLIGGFQAENVLVAAGLALASGEAADRVAAALPRLETVRGRMQLAATRENGAAVFVDYAHTPDAIATALRALRPHVMGRLVAVIGAGGDRDRGKRPLMGRAAAEHADVVFVTDDNPRSEVPGAIRAEILQACPEATEVGDRAEAILRAVDALGPGDALLVMGKGHERGQTVGDTVYPFDDVEQASVAVAALDGRLG